MNQDFPKAITTISFFYQWMDKEWACDPDLANEIEGCMLCLWERFPSPDKRYRTSNSLFVFCWVKDMTPGVVAICIWVSKHKCEKPTCWIRLQGMMKSQLCANQPYKWLLDFLVIRSKKKCERVQPSNSCSLVLCTSPAQTEPVSLTPYLHDPGPSYVPVPSPS